jgi:hypothetical protein
MNLREKRNEYYRIINPDLRNAILEKYNHKCAKCNSSESLEIDHIQALSLGGTNDVDNFQILCRTCNKKKGGKKSPGGKRKETSGISRNEVNLTPEAKAILKKLAVKHNHSLKSYMEWVLIKYIDDKAANEKLAGEGA